MDGGWWERLRRVDPRIWDALLALGMVAVGVLAFALRDQRPDEPPAALGFALVVVAGASLAWRRRAPLTVATIVCAAVATAWLFWLLARVRRAAVDRGVLGRCVHRARPFGPRPDARGAAHLGRDQPRRAMGPRPASRSSVSTRPIC